MTVPPWHPQRHDEGSALIMVLGTMTVMMLFVSVALGSTLQTMRTARHATAWNQAFAAAEAGVDDYMARLNRDDNYWRTPDCTNLAQRRPTPAASPVCGWGPSTSLGWLPIQGRERAEFHYDVDVTKTPNDGTVDLVSTGRVAGVTRTVMVTMRREGFGEFLYYTDYETRDPADYADPITAQDKCSHYYWEPLTTVSKPRDDSCLNINFITGDRIDGPVHSNDAILATGTPWFTGSVTTSWPACKPTNPTPTCYRKGQAGALPRFDKGISYHDEIKMATSIGNLRQYVTASPATAKPGCLYTGPTRIVFLPTVAGTPKMKVWSKWSTTPLNPGCGTAGESWPQTVDVPQNNLIMVQDVPTAQSTPAPGPCAKDSIGDGFPLVNDYNNLTSWDADCRYGTVYIEGALKGRVTISADNNVVVTGDLTYQGTQNGTDALGLIAENSVQIYHPVFRPCTHATMGRCDQWGAGTNLAGPDGQFLTEPKVHASIQTLRHSFEVQAYDQGDHLGTIHLFGTIAQRYRGIVGQSGADGPGYLKDYSYDSRSRYSPPPFFLDPVGSSWGTKTFGELSPRYAAP